MNMDDTMFHRCVVLIVSVLLGNASCQRSLEYSAVPESSPCPHAFTYEVENSVPGRWYGLIHITTDVTLYGVWVNAILDKQADALASSFGEVSSADNRDFKLENTRQTLTPSTQLQIRIYVNYNSVYTAPKLRSLRLNGREICAIGFPSVTTQQISDHNKRSTNVYDGRRETYYPTSTVNTYRDFTYPNEGSRSSTVDRNAYEETSVTRSRTSKVNAEPQDTYHKKERSIPERDSHNRREASSNSGTGGFTHESRDGFEDNANSHNRGQGRIKYNNEPSFNRDNTNTNRDNTRSYSNDQTARPREQYEQSSNRDNERVHNNNNDRYNQQDRRTNIDEGGTRDSGTNTDDTRRNSNRDEYGFNRDRESTSSRDQPIYNSQNVNNGNRRTNSNERRNDDDPVSVYALSNVGGGRGYEASTRRQSNGYDQITTTARNRPITPYSNDYDRETSRPSGRVSPLSPSITNNERDNRGQRGRSSVSTQTYSRNPNHSRPIQTHNSDEDYENADDDHISSRKQNRGRDSNDYFEGDHAIPDSDKIHATPVTPVNHNYGNVERETQPACGKVAVRATPLIVSGDTALQGEWPWHVALYQSQTVDSKYICGGSLISLNHVLTAAHCVTRKTSARSVNPQTLTLYLGKYNLRKASDGVQILLVRKIIVHPEYNFTNFYADLSILKMARRAEYSNVVRPVCLWREHEKDLSNVVDKEGSVVGWGFDENDSLKEDLAVVRMPVVKQTTCLWSFKEFFSHFTSNHSYCAGYANGTSVCNGDSGGGMVFPITEYSSESNNPTWYLRGVVSISVARQNDTTCDPYHYVVFTDVAQYLDWIYQKIS